MSERLSDRRAIVRHNVNVLLTRPIEDWAAHLIPVPIIQSERNT